MFRKYVAISLLLSVFLAGCRFLGSGTPPPSPVSPQAPPQTKEPVADLPETVVTPAEESGLPSGEAFIPLFEETDCPFEIPEVVAAEISLRCGFVVVPQDHQNPEGGTLRLATVVYEDQSPNHQPDPVLVLSGGPGEKTVRNTILLLQILSSIHPDRDMILFDQRGVGHSQPALECPEWVQMQLDVLDETDPETVLQDAYAAWMACQERLVAEGHNLSLYTTAQSAADVDAIRRALGYEQVNLFGGSYGSFLAQATMRDYPENIRSVIIDSVWPLEKSLLVEGSITATDAIMRLLEACQADPACNEAYPNLDEVLFEVLAELDENPVPATITHPVSGEEYEAYLMGRTILTNLVVFLYETGIIPVLPQAIYDVSNGEYDQMIQLRGLSLNLLDAMSRGMTMSVLCSEDLVNRTPQDLLEAGDSLPPELIRFDMTDELILEYGAFALCEGWPVEQVSPEEKEPLVSDIPTLVLGGQFDPVTPPEYGVLVASHLSNSYQYEFPGIGHSVNVASSCARGITAQFLADPSQAPKAACIEQMPGVVFDLPQEAVPLELQPFEDQERGFRGLVPVGWEQLAPANMKRGSNALDPTYFVLEATPTPMEDLFGALAAQLGIAPDLAPVGTQSLGNYEWDIYQFELQSNPVDLALTEAGGKTMFVLMIATEEEYPTLHGALFLPAVEAMELLENG